MKAWMIIAVSILSISSSLQNATSSNERCNHSCLMKGACMSKKFSNKCYYIFNDKERTWAENKKLCRKHNMSMLMVTHASINSGFNLKSFINEGFAWLGGREENLSQWTFVNDVPLKDTAFAKDTEARQDLNCGVFNITRNSLTIQTKECNGSYPSICLLDDYITPLSASNWYEATSRCTELGGALFFLRPNETVKDIQDKLKFVKDGIYFIGLTHMRWKWEDESHINYFKFEDKPSIKDNNCLLIFKSNSWSTQDCSLTLKVSICQEDGKDEEGFRSTVSDSTAISLVISLALNGCAVVGFVMCGAKMCRQYYKKSQVKSFQEYHEMSGPLSQVPVSTTHITPSLHYEAAGEAIHYEHQYEAAVGATNHENQYEAVD